MGNSKNKHNHHKAQQVVIVATRAAELAKAETTNVAMLRKLLEFANKIKKQD
jgi:hypothetical protein